MAEDPIRVNKAGPINLGLYDDSVDPGITLDWAGFVNPVANHFSLVQFWQNQYGNPNNFSLLATQPNPNTMLLHFQAAALNAMPFFSPVPLESAPTVSHTTYLQVTVGLWSNQIPVDPGGASGEECSTVPAACKPLAELELNDAPIAVLVQSAVPVADLEQNAAPVADLECQILS
jgi:hypothetical protein